MMHTESNSTYINDNNSNGQGEDLSAVPLAN